MISRHIDFYVGHVRRDNVVEAVSVVHLQHEAVMFGPEHRAENS